MRYRPVEFLNSRGIVKGSNALIRAVVRVARDRAFQSAPPVVAFYKVEAGPIKIFHVVTPWMGATNAFVRSRRREFNHEALPVIVGRNDPEYTLESSENLLP